MRRFVRWLFGGTRRRHWLWFCQAALLVSAALQGAGLVAPALTTQPRFGQFDGWVRLLRPDLARPTTFSLVGGIRRLLSDPNASNVAIGVILLTFSVLFPIIKLAVLSFAASRLARNGSAGSAFVLAHHGGKLSMLDLLVVAVLIVLVKGLPGGTTMDARIGIWLFAGSVLLALLVSGILHEIEAASVTVAAPGTFGSVPA